ncbi:adenosylcobinamide-GDP ribazoletransferase [Gottfriedia acidiceleris]|uniref:adenosylcobinamide-GDP ribazoletransferase n=1 Tax=Gottfriedia acidiceleris TaxID=371036 RepID=UPI002FFE9F05
MGVIAAICLIAGKIVAVYEVVKLREPLILVLSPWMARFLLICAIKFWPYRNEAGLGSGLSAFLSYPIMLIHLVLILGISNLGTGLNLRHEKAMVMDWYDQTKLFTISN